jgi:DNA protecting protein DprA
MLADAFLRFGVASVLSKVLDKDVGIARALGVDSDDVDAFFCIDSAAMAELDAQLAQIGAKILCLGDVGYPSALLMTLKNMAPPALFVLGDERILAGKSVGFCGSRSASDKGINVARLSAMKLSQLGVNVVSGYARGVDMAAHIAALEGVANTIIVLAEGILNFKIKKEFSFAYDAKRCVVISEFSPRAPWSIYNAMMRNKTIISVSDVMVVIETGMKGGTFSAATDTLRFKKPLFVAQYAMPSQSAEGNNFFIDRGATPLKGNVNGDPNIQNILNTVESVHRCKGKSETSISLLTL